MMSARFSPPNSSQYEEGLENGEEEVEFEPLGDESTQDPQSDKGLQYKSTIAVPE